MGPGPPIIQTESEPEHLFLSWREGWQAHWAAAPRAVWMLPSLLLGAGTSSSGIKSPRWLSSSSPIGVSREVQAVLGYFQWSPFTFCTDIFRISLKLSPSGLRVSSKLLERLPWYPYGACWIVSTMWTGILMVSCPDLQWLGLSPVWSHHLA